MRLPAKLQFETEKQMAIDAVKAENEQEQEEEQQNIIIVKMETKRWW